MNLSGGLTEKQSAGIAKRGKFSITPLPAARGKLTFSPGKAAETSKS